MQKRTLIPIIFWSLLCGAFLFISAPRVLDAIKLARFGPIHSFHTTDNYLAALTKTTRGSERILRVMHFIPSHKPIAIFRPVRDPESSFLAAIVTYFSWPREVRTLWVANGDIEGQLRGLDPAAFSAVVFCGMEPPSWMSGGIRVGTKLYIRPLAALEEEP